MTSNTRTITPVPLLIGTLLWGAATSLLLEDAIRLGHYDVSTMATPILTAATVAAACLSHIRLRQWKLICSAGFAALALLGSTVMVSGTLGRLAESKDGKEAEIQAVNRTYSVKDAELATARKERDKECRTMGPKCKDWQSRVDTLTAELSSLVVRSSDAKADAIGRIATLLGRDGKQAKAIMQALDPVLIPLFLELGSVIFFGCSFGHHHLPRASERKSEASVAQVSVLNQRELAREWGVHESTVSRRLRALEVSGQVSRQRAGKSKIAQLPPPARKRA